MKKHSFKKVLALLIAIIMVIPAIPVVASAATTTATPTDPTYVNNLSGWLAQAKDPSDETGKTVLINDKDDLIYFMMLGQLGSTKVTMPDGASVDNRFTGYTFKLTDDIVFNDGEVVDGVFVPSNESSTIDTWSPFRTTNIISTSTGEQETPNEWYGFRGIFDGQGYTISGIVINGGSEAGTGFFAHTGRGVVVKNVNFENMYISVTGDSTSNATYYTGSLIGLVSSDLLTQVKNVDIDCTIAASGMCYVGGVIGGVHKDGEVTMDNVSVDCSITGGIGVGGLIGRTVEVRKYDESDSYGQMKGTGTLTIKNCFVNGVIGATTYAGGFIGTTGESKTIISDSICYANVNVSNSKGNLLESVAGFVCLAEGDITMTNCQFLGSVTTGKNAAWRSAFATLGDVAGTAVGGTSATDSSTQHTATFVDCYFASGHGQRGVSVYKSQTNYTVSIDYTGDTITQNVVDPETGEDVIDETTGEVKTEKVEVPAVVISMADVAVMTKEDGSAFGQGDCGNYISNNFKTYYISSATGTDSAILGAQMGTENNARIVATVAGDKNITDIEFATITLDKYMKEVNTSGNLGWKSYSPSEKTHCGYAYKSLKDNFGLGTVTAGENEYLVALAICGVEAEKATTVLVRTAYYTPSVDADTGEVKSVRSYGQYMAVTFYKGEILGTAYVG